MVLASDGDESSDATLAHSHHPRGPILTLRPTVQGWEGTDLILEWGAERGGSGVEFLMDISGHLQNQFSLGILPLVTANWRFSISENIIIIITRSL